MVRAISLVRREVFAGAKDQFSALAALGHPLDIRSIAGDRTVHAALALAHLALTVAFTLAFGERIGPVAGAALCFSAAAVALLLLLRAAEAPAAPKTAHPVPESPRAAASATGASAQTAPRGHEGARREVSGLLAMMSHELRTPLNAILGNAEAMRHEILGPLGGPRYRDSALHILEGGQNLLRATEDMLALTGAVAAAAFAPHHPVDLEAGVRDVLKDAAREAARRKVALSWQTSTDHPVLSEATALQHALARIIDGALAHADDGASIHVELTPYGRTVELMVTLTHSDAQMGSHLAGRVDCGADRGPAALQIAVARTLASLLGTHLHTAHGIDGRWRAILDLPIAPAH